MKFLRVGPLARRRGGTAGRRDFGPSRVFPWRRVYNFSLYGSMAGVMLFMALAWFVPMLVCMVIFVLLVLISRRGDF